jgi:type I restriction enzyme R subunit
LDVPFAYSSNGHSFVEFDFLGNRSRELDTFPKPNDLWNRWQVARTGKIQSYGLGAKEEQSGYGAIFRYLGG